MEIEGLLPEQARVAVTHPKQLRAWMARARPWIVMRSVDLVDALSEPWPDAIEAFQIITETYEALRRTKPTHIQNQFHEGTLSTKEIDDLIGWLQTEARPAAEARERMQSRKNDNKGDV